MSKTIPDKLTNFLQMMLPERNELLRKIEQECQEDYIPLVAPETGQFLQVMVEAFKPKRILEVGTGIGYSTILMATTGDGWERHITTIEIDTTRYARACQNFRDAQIADIVNPLLGNASDIIPTLTDNYDFVFMDAAKGQYPDFFSKVWPLLNSRAMLVIDNVFLNGWVIDMTWPERRKKTMVCRVRDLLETLKKHPELATSLIPLGDGLAVSVRR
ncbi:MAG: O-methyltransferase [Firmicutes bacterium HGW-Firmicutes-12]|nr:MAG: O-methyltransferase [Firmicutes bacterium HGW-Firmicutes-12]